MQRQNLVPLPRAHQSIAFPLTGKGNILKKLKHVAVFLALKMLDWTLGGLFFVLLCKVNGL